MKVRSVVLALALALLVGVTACSKKKSETPQGMGENNLQAQHSRMTPQERTDRLAEQLTLTADQKTKVLDLFTLEETSFQKPSAGDTSDREAMRAAMEKRREELNTKLKAILTKEQFAQYEKLRSERSRGMGEHTPPAQP